jgi:hypothetical protein
MRFKTVAMKTSNKYRGVLMDVMRKTNISWEEQQFVLEWNFGDMDPLYTERKYEYQRVDDDNLLVFLIVDSFLKCQSQWKNHIVRKFARDALDLRDLDEGKGYFLKEDFTRFLSIKSQQMYCNRAVNLIFKRINKNRGKVVGMEDLYDTLCN